jgi:UDP-N-acetylglucosamine 2-epimerase
VLIMRETTERQEAIEAGAAELVGTDPDTIVGRATTLLRDEDAYAAMATPRELFGDGHAAERIVSTSEEFLRSTASAPQASLRVLPSERPDGIVLEAWPSSAATG